MEKLKLHQFVGDNGNVKSTYQVIEGLEEAKTKISSVKSVEEWNILRDELKSTYPMEVISALDASRHIKSLNL